MRARRALGTDRAGLVVANPLPQDEQLDPALHDRVLAEALAGAEAEGVHGKDATPFLLARFHRETQGAQPRGEHPDHPAQRRAGRPDRGGARGAADDPRAAGPVLVVGDLMVDVVARVDDPLALGTDTPATCRPTRAGPGPTWRRGWPPRPAGALRGPGRRRPVRRNAVEALRDGGVDVRVAVDPSRATGTWSCWSAPTASARCSPTPARTPR